MDLGLLLDPLSITFVLLITGVGSLIHVYSIGYMAHDPDRRQFFAYLNLFVAAMLLLVLGDTFLAALRGLGGRRPRVLPAHRVLVRDRPSAATAAKKAFVMNRVGDVGLVAGDLADVHGRWARVDFDGVSPTPIGSPPGTVTAIGAAAAARRLRQVRPVAAAGLAARRDGGPDPGLRAHPRGDHGHRRRLPDRPVARRSTTLHRDGAHWWSRSSARSRCCSAAIVGCAKDDIKKVLAVSTVSQIGYMFLAVGLGAGGYAIGILHLLTHGFFKAGLFLGAGSVMHAMNDDVDMRRYGGLPQVMPITFVTLACGYLAIIGFPLFVRLLHQGQDHRGRVRQAAARRAGCSARSRCSAPASPRST